ncbi:MAG: hypothetical protein HOH79_06440 [Euryarchaeota archaeon]|nr:hypothetical protein [Euryarchaeota archaeon]
MVQRLFGTDGIRGKIVDANPDEKAAIMQLHDDRSVCPTLMRLVGEALGHLIDTLPGEGEHVVIGWDNRPGNQALVDGVTLGLRLAGCSVTHIGICATPALHYAVLWHKARLGCMMTASHNPASDSGIKVFDAEGYKTSPVLEDKISELVYALCEEEREIDEIDHAEFSKPDMGFSLQWGGEHHPLWLSQRLTLFRNQFGISTLSTDFIHRPLLLDCSKGSASSWFAEWLTDNGIESRELSQTAPELNKNCGAGDFSPTATWTFEEAASSQHVLLKNLKPAPPGTIVGAALDGDGDRCLVIESTESGFRVIDGDAMADAMVVAGTQQKSPWLVAASIESDLALLSSINRLPVKVETIETAVGDRWLSHALRSSLVMDSQMPRIIGVEDSGHAVLPSPHPHNEQNWSLVGDGAATLLAYLLARSTAQEDMLMMRGWKQRVSVQHVRRELWDGNNPLSDEIERIARSHLEQCGKITQWNRHGLEGEENLMLIEALLGGAPLSLGIRNSGTQAKISISLRLSSSIESEKVALVMPKLAEQLANAMC